MSVLGKGFTGEAEPMRLVLWHRLGQGLQAIAQAWAGKTFRIYLGAKHIFSEEPLVGTWSRRLFFCCVGCFLGRLCVFGVFGLCVMLFL